MGLFGNPTKSTMLFSKAIGALICVHLVIATTFPSIDPELRPSVPSTTPVSSVDTSLTTYDRIVLKVGDEPFFYNGVQIRVDKLQDIWNRTDSDNQQLFVDAANFGFTVINTQVRWMDIQPDASYNATESTYVQGGASANVNFSKNSTLRIAHASSAGDQAVSFIKFDFTPYDRANISGAKVRVYVDRWSDNNATFPATLVGLTDNSWDASSATWNNGAPNWNSGNFAGSNGSDWFALASSPSWDLIHSPAYYDFDVSDFIANHCPDKVATFAVLAQPNATVSAVGASIDGASGSVPPSLTLSDETHFQWDYVDKLMSWSQQAGIKFEPIWFGSDTTSETIDNRVPYFLLRNIKNEQVTSDGSHRPVLIKNDPFKSRGLGVYQFLMDKNDPKTRRQEYTAINAMMEHISEWDKANGNQKTVIGVDVANEPAVSLLHGGQFTPWQNPVTWGRLSEFPSVQAFVNRTAWEFTNNLANAVKDSSYPVWTRSNDYQGADAPGVWYNELMRENGGTSLDFIGIDPYSNDTERSFAVGHDVFFYNGTGKNLKQEFAIGRNLPMIMENAGYYNNSDKVSFWLPSLAEHCTTSTSFTGQMRSGF